MAGVAQGWAVIGLGFWYTALGEFACSMLAESVQALLCVCFGFAVLCVSYESVLLPQIHPIANIMKRHNDRELLRNSVDSEQLPIPIYEPCGHVLALGFQVRGWALTILLFHFGGKRKSLVDCLKNWPP